MTLTMRCIVAVHIHHDIPGLFCCCSDRTVTRFFKCQNDIMLATRGHVGGQFHQHDIQHAAWGRCHAVTTGLQ